MTKLSQKKAAAHLGIAASTLSSYCRRGIAPPHVSMHGIRYFDVVALDAWLDARRGGSQ
jgi:DNA-binding transcriptional MerR regulator